MKSNSLTVSSSRSGKLVTTVKNFPVRKNAMQYPVNPAKRKATSVQNEKRFLEQKRKAIQNPGHFPFQQAIRSKHKRHSNSL